MNVMTVAVKRLADFSSGGKSASMRWIFSALLGFCVISPAFGQNFLDISRQSQLYTAADNNGVAVADYDNDGDLDVFVVTRWDGKGPVTSQLFRNNNDGTFTNVTEGSGITSTHDYTNKPAESPHPVGEKMGASWGDFNNDGYADLFLTNAFYLELYQNNCDGTFVNVTSQMGIPEENECINNVGLWFDYNNDSFLDLYVTGVITVASCRGKLYRNNGGRDFTEVSAAVGLKDSGRAGWTAMPMDVNDDGCQDLYIANDFGAVNHLYINQKGSHFVDSAEQYGVTDIFMDGMGVTQGDYDGDGLLDFFITNINESSLYRNTGNGSFIQQAPQLGVATTGWAWGCQFEDFDHDADMDLVVVNGYYDRDQDRYYRNTLETGIVGFLDRSQAAGFGERTISNSLATFDYDHDGDMDLLICHTGDHLGFFENQTIQMGDETGKDWVTVRLVGTHSNRDAIGTRLRLYADGKTLVRYHHGAGLMSQNRVPVHFGLGACQADSLVIQWPSGITQIFTNVPSNAHLRVTEGAGMEVLQLTNNKIRGCTDPNSCNYNPQATFNDGSCEYLESKPIRGNPNSGLLSQERYTYPAKPGHTYHWEITNGEVVEGQGTPSVLVKWEIYPTGVVSVTEMGTCFSNQVSLNVNLFRAISPERVSVARLWNEALLAAIREDYARPTVHARNLFHTSVAMYDAWSIVTKKTEPYLIGKQLHNFQSTFDGFETPLATEAAADMAVSYAAYRLLLHRFRNSPNAARTQQRLVDMMTMLGYDPYKTFNNYRGGDPAALGNFIGEMVIEYGLVDGANEGAKYANQYYQPINEPLAPTLAGNPGMQDPNRWQPLQFDVFIDQAGNITPGNVPAFLSPEWGNVNPFSLHSGHLTTHQRDGHSYKVYLDPGGPPMLHAKQMSQTGMDAYKWNFALVSIWSSHLDPKDSVMWDISPAAFGNIGLNELPTNLENYDQFYDLLQGGDPRRGRPTNPVTGLPYAPQIVPRGDYARVLAEFWADGPHSETPPGHWYVLLNYLHDHPKFKRKWRGTGAILEPLEWDVKAYFALGGAMHDAAIAAWSIKGWYDFVRPISAIRYMASKGQSTDPALPRYHQDGLPLISGYIELVEAGDPLAGPKGEHVGKIKLYTWRGHDYIKDPATDQAGVDWILAEDWWPYQRPTFVTPPFAGYVSGHSTYSRAAAELLTRLTGTSYFPGGMGEFVARKNEFLVFEEGPSQDIKLQWATYQDASDQCSLSRIWGGIHPPADDIAGRMIGARIGAEAFIHAENYFRGMGGSLVRNSRVYPVPAQDHVYVTNTTESQEFQAFDLQGRSVVVRKSSYNPLTAITEIAFPDAKPGIYVIRSGQGQWRVMLQ